MLLQDSLPSASSQPKMPISMSNCALTWRDRKLFVQAVDQSTAMKLDVLNDFGKMVECLKRSPVDFVKLDCGLGLLSLKKWVEACALAGKVCYLAIDSPFPDYEVTVWRKGLSFLSSKVSQLCGLLSLLCLSPLMVLAMIRITLKGNSLRLQEAWACDYRGRVLPLMNFQVIGNKNMSNLETPSTLVKFAYLLNITTGKVNIFITPPRIIEAALESETI